MTGVVYEENVEMLCGHWLDPMMAAVFQLLGLTEVSEVKHLMGPWNPTRK